MNYLLDTCILSELVRKTPDSLVVNWFNQQRSEQLFLSCVSVAEIKKGLYKLKPTQPERFNKLRLWLDSIEEKFIARILPLNEAVLDTWADISANAELQGYKLAVMDSLIAATARQYQLTLVTRNVDDFKNTSINIINPYQSY